MFETKLLKRMILMVSMLGMILLSMPGVSSAEDVWCYSNGSFSYYLSSDTISRVNYTGGITYAVDGVTVFDRDGSLGRPLMYGFSVPNDYMMAFIFDRSNGKWNHITDDEGLANAMAVWEAMKPYMKQKGIHYSDSWQW